MNDFTIRAFGFQELALCYFPNSLPASAAAQLRKWIRIEPLAHLLQGVHYHAGQKILTPRQVGVIVGHLGAP